MSHNPTKPTRIQLSRKKGFRLPPNTVVVSRPSKWGNPFRVTSNEGLTVCEWTYCDSQKSAVANFRLLVSGAWPASRGVYPSTEEIRNQLRGKNLACWCLPGTPCHADVLLEIANA